MTSTEPRDEITSVIVKKKLFSEGVKKAHRLLDTFETNDRANRRIAVIGMSALFIIIFVLVLRATVFDEEVEPDFIVIGRILQLKIHGEIDDPGNKKYLALVKLDTGEVVWADINRKIYSLFEKDHIVEVAYYSGASGNKYEVIIGQGPNAP